MKGKLPKSVVNQDPAGVSQSQDAGGKEDREGGSSGEEAEQPEEGERDEVLNQSDDDEDTVRNLFCCHDNGGHGEELVLLS